MAVALVMRGLHQDEDKIIHWPLDKLFIYARLAAKMENMKFD